jgi:hypothetical protein
VSAVGVHHAVHSLPVLSISVFRTVSKETFPFENPLGFVPAFGVAVFRRAVKTSPASAASTPIVTKVPNASRSVLMPSDFIFFGVITGVRKNP